LTTEPIEQRFGLVDDRVEYVPPSAVPHVPAMLADAEQVEEAAPPFSPLQVQFQDAAPVFRLGVVAVPVLQRPVVGALAKGPPLGVPQEPATTARAEQVEEVAPPFAPLQVQVHCPVAVFSTGVPVALPTVQRPVEGADAKGPPLGVPH
jgi:hypothetical protein